MAIILTRKQSLWLGIGLLGAFFVISGVLVAVNSASRIPSSSSLSRDSVAGARENLTPSPLSGESAGLSVTASESGKSSEGSSAFVLNEFQRSLVQDGKTVWEIVGKRGKYDPATSSAEVEEPRLTLSTKSGEPAVLTAGRAVLSMEGPSLSKADLYERVVLLYKDNTTLRTSKATYDKKTELVEIPVFVEIENDVVLVSGERLTGNVVTQEFTLSGGVKSVIKPRVSN